MAKKIILMQFLLRLTVKIIPFTIYKYFKHIEIGYFAILLINTANTL
jgi:hypothetical protein